MWRHVIPRGVASICVTPQSAHAPKTEQENNNSNNENKRQKKNDVEPESVAIGEREREMNTEYTRPNNHLALARFVWAATGKCCRMAACEHLN